MQKKQVNLKQLPLDWKEVYYTNCPLVSASNVDQELGWTKEEYKKMVFSTFIFVPAKKMTGIRTTSTIWIMSSGLADYFRRFMFMRISAEQDFSELLMHQEKVV